VDALANPSLQRGLSIALAVIAGLGALTCAAILWSARRPMSAQARVLRRRVGAVALFIAVAAAAAGVVLSLPVDAGPVARPAAPGPAAVESEEVVSARRFSSARLPALSLDAPDGWRLELDKASHKLTVSGAGARLLISTAILNEVVDADLLLGRLADGQRALGNDVGDTFTDRVGDLPAVGFLAKNAAGSVCARMVKRDTHLASSVICTSDGKTSARDACRAPLASLRWREPAP